MGLPFNQRLHDGGRIGRVDDVEFAVAESGDVSVVALACGQRALGRRLGGTLGGALEATASRFDTNYAHRGEVARIPADLVEELSSVVSLSRPLRELPGWPGSNAGWPHTWSAGFPVLGAPQRRPRRRLPAGVWVRCSSAVCWVRPCTTRRGRLSTSRTTYDRERATAGTVRWLAGQRPRGRRYGVAVASGARLGLHRGSQPRPRGATDAVPAGGLPGSGGAGERRAVLAPALAGAISMQDNGRSKKSVVALWAGATVLLAAAVFAGRFAFAGASPETLALPLAFAGGAVLTSVIDTLAPEAFGEGGPLIALASAAGFVTGYMLSL